MLLIITILGAVIAAVIVFRLRVTGTRDGPQLGWVSERWLREHRDAKLE